MTLQLTNAGINALLRATAGDSLTLSCVKIGNGAAQAAGAATDLSNPLVTLSITECTVANQRATISVTLNNSTIDAGFRLTEIGVFAQDQDDSAGEILYAYGTEPEATADYIAASGDNILEEDITIDVFVGNAENVSAIINESLVYATKAAFDAHVANHENPHAVTKAQVGLSSVPNVATNDQTPTFTPPASNANLISGERLTVSMGKIARAVASLISHLANKANPHSVTAEQVSAAAKSHTHSAADVTSGVLSVRRGGTGKGDWEANRLFYPSAAAVFSQLAFPSKAKMVLMQDTYGAPYWGLAGTETGSYVGQNRSGASQQNSITLKGPPAIVFIMESGVYNRWGVLFPSANRGFSVYNGVTSDLIVGGGGGNGVSWYLNSSESHPANQLDAPYKTYHYVAFY